MNDNIMIALATKREGLNPKISSSHETVMTHIA